MCGIMGYIGSKNACKYIIDGLKRLEYRGYDSWGIALKSNPSIIVKKFVGAITEHEIGIDFQKAHAGIGHTRWATHGGVDEKNAHPHLCCEGKIAVVHNGIVENYDELRKLLEKKGHVFRSETDSEVVAHLIEDRMNSGLSFGMAFKEALKEIEGSYAIVAMHSERDALLCAKKDSPLVIGIADHGYFVASDVPAFLPYTNRVVFLDDEEMAVITRRMRIIDLKKERVIKKECMMVDWDHEQAKKGNHRFFMEKEIMEQRHSLLRAISQDDKTIEKAAKLINDAYGVFFVACGSSYNAALSASYIFSKISRKHINVVDASEFRYYLDFITPETLVIAISQSGETADVLDAVKNAKKKRAKIMAITNVMGSSLMRLADFTLLTNCGPEICVVATKSYTAQLAVLILLAYAIIGRKDEGRRVLKSVSHYLDDLLSDGFLQLLDDLASRLKDKGNIFCIGRGVSYATALEAALKIKEVTYIHAEGFAGGALKHGNIALIEEGTPCIVFAPNDETYREIISNAMEVKSRGGWIIAISPKEHEVYDDWIKIPDFGLASTILNIVPIQYISYRIAVLKNLDPDKPRNLAKSVTVK